MEIQNFSRVSQMRIGEPILRIRVLLLRVWMWMSSGADLRICMILSDGKGFRIQATVHRDAYEKFKFFECFEGYWFRLSCAKVEPSVSGTSLTPHKCELRFDSETGFFPDYDEIDLSRFLVYPTFSEIFDRKVDDAYPIDVLGVVTWVGDLENEWTGNKLQITLRDVELRSIECLVYGREAEDLITRFYMEYDNHVFIILRCFYVVRWNGHTWLKGREGLSTIMYDQYANQEWFSLVNRYPDPVPEEYPDENDKRCIVF